MAEMFQELDFEYDGIKGSDKGLSLVKINSDNIFSFGTNQSIIEEKIKTIDEPFFHGISRDPITFPLTFAILDNELRWDFEKRGEIVQWLFQSDYKPFISADNPSICYYIMAVGENERWDNGIQQGYVTISFRMMTPYAYTIKSEEYYEISQTENINLINRSNIKDYKYYPVIEFTLTGGATDITFKNLNDGGRELTFTGLNTGETIYIDNKRGEIISSTGSPRLSKCNRKWLNLVYGVNRIQVTVNNNGGASINVGMQFPLNF
jgi:phage-related protein